MLFRFLIIVGVGVAGAYFQGFAGVCYSLMIFGLGCFVYQIAVGFATSVAQAFNRPRYVQNSVRVDHMEITDRAMRGQRVNPDPTRPTTDDFMGIIEGKAHRK